MSKIAQRVAIIGAGAAGVFCALQILEYAPDADITLFEKNEALKTLLPTGGGRCNLSYDEPDFRTLAKNYPRGEKFLYSIFSKFGVPETLEYFEKIGVKTYKQADGRIFPVADSSKFVRDALLRQLKKFKNVRVVKNNIKSACELEGFDFAVIACGSKGGYELVLELGHTLTPMASALCSYITEEKYPGGVSISINGEPLLFTHIGISGPYVFKLSSLRAFWEYPFVLEVPFLDVATVFEHARANPKKAFKNVLCDFIPKSLAEVLDIPDVQCANIKKSEIEKLRTLNFTVLAPDKKGETVRAGGVDLKEIKNTCESKIRPNLYFIGEILDIDGLCGGFNLQNAWSTGAAAAQDILDKLQE